MSLDQAVRAVVDAVEHEGPSPALHHKIMEKHKEEWPTLHGALTNLRIEWHRHVAEDLIDEIGA